MTSRSYKEPTMIYNAHASLATVYSTTRKSVVDLFPVGSTFGFKGGIVVKATATDTGVWLDVEYAGGRIETRFITQH